MKIEEIQNIIRVGEITEGTRLYSGNKRVAYDYALVLDYDDSLPKGLVNKYLSIVYIFVVDGEGVLLTDASGGDANNFGLTVTFVACLFNRVKDTL